MNIFISLSLAFLLQEGSLAGSTPEYVNSVIVRHKEIIGNYIARSSSTNQGGGGTTETDQIKPGKTITVDANGELVMRDPVINFTKGYYTEEVAKGVFWITDGGYHSMAVVHEKGVVVVDAPATMFKVIGAAIREVAGALPVTHMIYSHHHADHMAAVNAVIALGTQKCDVQIIAHEETRKFLEKRKDPRRPPPNVVFTEAYTLSVGGKEIQMKYQGPNHTPGNIYVYLPQDKVLMCVDVLYAGWVPFKNLAATEDIGEFLSTPKYALDNFDFKILIGGHLTRMGNRKDVLVHKEYLDTTLRFAKEALLNTNMTEIAASLKNVPPLASWKLFDAYFGVIADKCAAKNLEYWKDGPLRGMESYVKGHCFVIALSENIDIGYISSTEELNN